MSFDSKMVALALKLISKRGKTVTYSDASDSAYDPATGTQTVTRTPYTIKARVQDYTFRNAGSGFEAGLIREGDKEIMIAASGLAFLPQSGDRVTVDGVTFTALNIKVIYAVDSITLFIIHARQ